jgi:hypothetical protein
VGRFPYPEIYISQPKVPAFTAKSWDIWLNVSVWW